MFVDDDLLCIRWCLGLSFMLMIADDYFIEMGLGILVVSYWFSLG